MRKLLSLFVLITIFSCNDNDPDFVEGLEYELKVDETLNFSDENLSIFLSSDIEDTRCADGTNCIEAGFVKINLSVNDRTGNYNFSLASIPNPDGFLISYELQDHIITLVDVIPYPTATGRINPSERRAILKIVRK